VDGACPSPLPSPRRAGGGRKGEGWCLAAVVAVLLHLACGSGNDGPSAPPQDLSGLTRVSGPTPFAAGCEGAATAPPRRNAEVEPSVAIDPGDPTHLVGVWQQDRFPESGASGIVTAVSRDGGRTWRTTSAAVSRCSGGAGAGADYERASDPWVTIAPDGTVYQAALGFDAVGTAKGILVSRSQDGGDTWGPPVAVARETSADLGLDKESITADPDDFHRVYAVWDRLTGQSLAIAQQTGPAWLSRTVDGGATWEQARPIFDPGLDAQTIGNQIAVLPDGTLLDLLVVIAGLSSASPVQTVAVLRSLDQGVTWSAPVPIAVAQVAGVIDPKGGQTVRTGSLVPSIAVDRQSGAAYVAWEDSRPSGGARDGIVLSRSLDGGASWSPPVQVNRAPAAPAFTPVVAVSAAGEVGVTYYDLSEDDPADKLHLFASYWLATSSDGGTTWTATRVAHRFDLRTAPLSDGYFLGDYEGLVHDGRRFVPFFVIANNGDVSNRTDVFVVTPP
jgi:hypothetical protein